VSHNLRVVVSFTNQGEDLVFSIKDINQDGGKRWGEFGPLLVSHFVEHEPALPAGSSVNDLKSQLEAMLRACSKPVLVLVESVPLLQEWKGRK